MSNLITLAGKPFRAIKHSTIEHDFHAMALLREANLHEVYMQEGETPEDFAMRILNGAIASGKAFDLLGTFLVPAAIEDGQWSPAVAHETAALLRHTTDLQEKHRIRSAVVSCIIGFFQSGLTYSMTSPKSSVSPKAEVHDSGSAAHSTLATGAI